MLPVIALVGCASVIPQYEASVERALADPGPVPDRWVPDAVLHLSDDTINTVVKAAIAEYGTFTETFDVSVAEVTPDLLLTSMRISPGDNCDDCVGIDIGLEGKLLWASSIFGRGETDLGATGSLDAKFTIDRSDNGDFAVHVQPRKFRFLDVTIGRITVGVAGLSETLKGWIDRNLVAQVPPQEIVVIESGQLPLLDLRIVPDGESVQLQMLTAAPTRGAVEITARSPKQGWRADLAPESLIAIAKAEMFKRDPLPRGIVPEPTMIHIDGGEFQLGLRLWRTEGRGWWRDYLIDGTVAVEGDEIKLTARDVQQVAKSAGAGFTDPLSALARGIILNFIEKAFEQSIPANQGDGTVVKIEGIKAMKGAIRVRGDIEVQDPFVGPRPPAPR